MNLPLEVKFAIQQAENRAEAGKTKAIKEMGQLLQRFPILQFDTETGDRHPLAVLTAIHFEQPELVAQAKRVKVLTNG